jgi:16S rRNA (cytosine967-C5)-methyltransferase
LRRRPDARWRIQPGDVEDLAGLQRNLLAAAALAVKPGGRLVYSVCTLTRTETLDIDEWAKGALPEVDAIDPPGPPWRPYGRGAILLPSDAHSDGMFVLVLERAHSSDSPG